MIQAADSTRNAWLIALAAMMLPISTAMADIDHGSTQGGANTPSGTWREALGNQLDGLLLQFNNDLTYDVNVHLDPLHVLDFVPTQDYYTVGQIMFSPDADTRLIYDRLAVRAVVYMIGYHDGLLPFENVSPVMLYTNDRQLLSTFGPLNLPAGSGAAGAGQTQQSTPNITTHVVPEPGSALLLALAAGTFMMRRGRSATNA